MKEIDIIISKLRHLKQYKGLSEEELEKIAKEKLYSPKWEGLTSVEAKEAKKRYNIYKSSYNIESYSDSMLLSELIYNEILAKRYKKRINDIKTKTDSFPPPSVIRTLGEIEDRLIVLREKLGLLERNKQDKFSLFFKKAQAYWKERGADQALPCPYCGKFIHLAPSMKYFELHKFPFLKSRLLYNEHLIRLYKSGKITIEDVAKVLKTSVDYVKWVIKKFEVSLKEQNVLSDKNAKNGKKS